LSAGGGALALLNNAVAIRRNPEMTFDTLERVVSNAPVFKGVRGEAREMVNFILNSFDN
jgi:hypothetical protein